MAFAAAGTTVGAVMTVVASGQPDRERSAIPFPQQRPSASPTFRPDWYFTAGTFETREAAHEVAGDAQAQGYEGAWVLSRGALRVPGGCRGNVDPDTGEKYSFCGYPVTPTGFVVVLVGPFDDDPPRGTKAVNGWHDRTRQHLVDEATARGFDVEGATLALEYLDPAPSR